MPEVCCGCGELPAQDPAGGLQILDSIIYLLRLDRGICMLSYIILKSVELIFRGSNCTIKVCRCAPVLVILFESNNGEVE